MISLDPATWDKEILSQLATSALPGHKEMGQGHRHVVSTQHPLSTYTGLQVLRAGGTAADALVAIVALEHVIMPGTSSLGGTMAVLYHDAINNQTLTLNAGLNTVLDDTEPYNHLKERETGRAVLVPGMIAGLEALWKRFGVLPWADLWSPAMYFAHEGFALYPLYARNLLRRSETVLRHPEGRAIFLQDGMLPQDGTILRQPLLATTLQQLATQGAGYAYQGAWAEQLVEAVQRLGGKMRMEDLARYTATWEEPMTGTYLDYEVRTTTPPHHGGSYLLIALNIAEALDLHHRPRRDQSAQTLFDEIQAWKGAMAAVPLKLLRSGPTVDYFLSKDYARSTAEHIRNSRPEESERNIFIGSHQVAIVDTQGNMITATHSIESDSWGDTGLFVGGISLNSSAYTRAQSPFNEPGGRVSESLSCYLVLRDQRPLFVAGAMGSGLLGCNLQNTLNMLAHGDDAATSIAAHRWGFFDMDIQHMRVTPHIQVEPFDDALLNAVEQFGQPLVRRSLRGAGGPYADTGYWAAAGFTEGTDERFAVTDPRLPGMAMGE